MKKAFFLAGFIGLISLSALAVDTDAQWHECETAPTGALAKYDGLCKGFQITFSGKVTAASAYVDAQNLCRANIAYEKNDINFYSSSILEVKYEGLPVGTTITYICVGKRK